VFVQSVSVECEYLGCEMDEAHCGPLRCPLPSWISVYNDKTVLRNMISLFLPAGCLFSNKVVTWDNNTRSTLHLYLVVLSKRDE